MRRAIDKDHTAQSALIDLASAAVTRALGMADDRDPSTLSLSKIADIKNAACRSVDSRIGAD